MSALTVDRAAAVGEAHAVLHLAMELLPEAQYAAVRAEVAALGDALEVYRELDAGALSWEWDFPELAGDADPDDSALRKAAAEVEAAAEDLIQVMAAYCGTEDEMKNAAAGVTA